MEVKKIKTVRFSELVKESGKPKQVILWTAPEDDREFSKASKEGRVLTIFQRNVGTQTDFGLVGFFKEKSAAFLVFPKELRYPVETKVVGIKYNDIEESAPKGPIFKPSRPGKPGIPMKEVVGRAVHHEEKEEKEEKKEKKERKPKPSPPPKPEPEIFDFKARVEITAKQRVDISVQAHSLKEASALLQTKAKEVQIDPVQAKTTRKVSKPVKQKAAE